MIGARTRLEPRARRQQILEVAAKEFATRPYNAVHMADVAGRAGVSRALVYRYYPTKRELFAAVYDLAATSLVEASSIESGAGLADQVMIGLDAHLDFFEANARSVLVANRGELAGDPLVEAIITRQLAELRQGMLNALGVSGHRRDVASVALHGWLSFVRAVCVEWLANQRVTREEVRELCLRVLSAAAGMEGS